ncbi:hypothetical protein LTR85_011030 [Meristemomyces frigidus]|nr:hypothetical protein LTR85_011030 [Meristemomyces frigidus]
MAKGRQTVRLPQAKRKHEDPSEAASKDSPAQKNDANHAFSPRTLRKTLGVALPLLALAAIASPVSQATLAPVYGSIPSSVNHAEAITATMLIGYLWRALLKSTHNWSILPYLALWALWTPLMQVYLFRYSSRLGPVGGPIISGFLSCHTIVIPSAYAAAQALEAFDLQEKLGTVGGVALPALALDLLYFRPLEYVMAHYALPWANTYFHSEFITPVKLQLIIGAVYTLFSPDKPYWLFSLAAPAAFHALLANPHFDSARSIEVLNRDLAPHNWTLLDRAWSNTGYISVLESTDLQYRVLRCDHSLLGGEWLLTPERQQKEGWKVNEPVYAVFEMLEAVRLMEVEPAHAADRDAQALVIGLGIGTAPKALMAHGISTTIVELDLMVHKYAQQYFGLPNTNTVLQDAVTWVESQQASSGSSAKYDYILHDVFTSGAEPLALFTDTFLSNLRSLLTPNGVIALNYAGDLSTPLTARALNTIREVFDGQCRIFRDAPPPENQTNSTAAPEEDFLNLVLFCRNTPGPITFRKPTAKDFLGSKSRAHYLLPRADYEINFPSVGNTTEAVEEFVLKKGKEGQWRKQQEESAIRHWHIMRRVLPAVVWEMW